MASACSNPTHPSQSNQTLHTLKEILHFFFFEIGFLIAQASLFCYEAQTDINFSFTQFYDTQKLREPLLLLIKLNFASNTASTV